MNSNTPLVSIVIASYNAGEFLPQAVESVCRSTYENIEVIVVDDGSTDNSAKLLEPMLSDRRVKYFYQENQGQTKAKNKGVKESTGEYIAFCDADDLWEANKLELQLPKFKNPKVGVVYSDLSYINENNDRSPAENPLTRYSGIVTNDLMIQNIVPFGTAIIRRECLEKNGIFNEKYKMGIDWDLWLRYSLDWEFDSVPEATYVYRRWSGQMSHNYIGRYIYAFQILQDFEDKYGDRLDKKVLQRAWADNYISKAYAYAKNENTFFSPLKNVLKGVWLEPTNVKGWKTMIKIIFRRL